MTTTTFQLVTTAQLAASLGITRQAISDRVHRGTLEPDAVLPNGMMLWNPTRDYTPGTGS